MSTRGTPIAPPLVPASSFYTPGDPYDSPYVYGRIGNPTWTALEVEHERLSQSPSLAFASGMAACAAVLEALVPPERVLVAPSDGYFSVRALLELRRVKSRLVDSTDPLGFARAVGESAAVWIESPTNPGLDIVDIAATAEACHRANAVLVVDNTLGTCIGQDPLSLGADVVVTSCSKATSGHSDAVIGMVATRKSDIFERLRTIRTLAGSIPGTLEAWLCLRGMKTLGLRLEASARSALQVAIALREHSVRYPGLHTHPQHALAGMQMRCFGQVVTFDLVTRERAERFCARLNLVKEATSFGGVESTVERRARWGRDTVSLGLLRMSVGLEPVEEIIADVQQALSGLALDPRAVHE